jgi:hypothetical protein
MMGELRNGYRIVPARLITNLNLTLKGFVTEPLWKTDSASDSYHTTRNDTNANADVCCRLFPERSQFLRVAKTMASTSSRGFEGQTKSPVYFLEKNGHLQHRRFNVLPLIGNGVRGPHFLGNYSASAHDSAVKKPRRVS